MCNPYKSSESVDDSNVNNQNLSVQVIAPNDDQISKFCKCRCCLCGINDDPNDPKLIRVSNYIVTAIMEDSMSMT